MPNIYDGVFLQKYVSGFSRYLYSVFLPSRLSANIKIGIDVALSGADLDLIWGWYTDFGDT